MINQETLRKLTEMKMGGMAELYLQQFENKDYQALDFADRFNLLVDYEYDRRKTTKLQRLIKNATFNAPSASVEDIIYHPDRHLDKKQLLGLATGNYLQNHHNIIFMGLLETAKRGCQMPSAYKLVDNFTK